MGIREPGSGELNRRVTLRHRTDLPADDMGLSATYDTQMARWAAIVPVGTATYNGGLQTDNKITHRVTVRYIAGIGEGWELVHGATVYRVKRGAPLGGRLRFLQLDVEELGDEQSPGNLYG